MIHVVWKPSDHGISLRIVDLRPEMDIICYPVLNAHAHGLIAGIFVESVHLPLHGGFYLLDHHSRKGYSLIHVVLSIGIYQEIVKGGATRH